MELKLEVAKKEELQILAEIYKTEFSKPPYNENWTDEKAIEKMNFFSKEYDLYSIFADVGVVGFIVINPNFMCPGEVAFGEEIAIKEDFQNKGIGTWTFKEIFKIYNEKGFKKFMGIVDVESKAFELYKELGINPSKKDILIEKELKDV
ncbi:GNAT family N-acetyltransferase [archaeon]|nr:GNAT family N-acetyltransferase [archaeon]